MSHQPSGVSRLETGAANHARDYRFDNLKALLIALVVLGHTIQYASRTSEGLFIRMPYWLDSIIFTFHMPVFVFVSGYFSSSRKGLVEMVLPMLGLYFLFQWLWTGYYCVVNTCWPDTQALTGLVPGWGLWYLLSLAIWRLTIPVLKRRQFPVIFLALAALAGAAAGYTHLGATLSLSRMVVFFPYFAAGFFARELNWQSLLGAQMRKIDFAVLVLAILLLPCLLYFVHISDRKLLYFDSPFVTIPIHSGSGFLFRILAYLFAFAAIRSLLLLIPKSQHRWTHIGEATLAIYLGHFYFLLILQQYMLQSKVNALFLLSPVVVVALLWLLSRPVLKSRIDAIYEWMRNLAKKLAPEGA